MADDDATAIGLLMPEPYGCCEQFRLNLTTTELQLFNEEEETYNPFRAMLEIYTGFAAYFRCWRHLKRPANDPISDLMAIGQVTWQDIGVLFGFTLMWTMARILLSRWFFEPFTRRWGMRPHAAAKFPECFFKTLAYFCLWLCAIYVTFFRGHAFFFNTLTMWQDMHYKFKAAPLDLRLMYGVEAGFYLHSSYATLFLDKWRRDSLVMLLHHIVTMTLIGFAYSVSHLKIGIIIFVLNDIGDVLLEGAKCFAYLKVKGARFEQLWHHLATTCSSLFAILWFFCRTMGHLTKVWRSSSYGTMAAGPYLPPPLYLFFNVLVGSLYLFYTYWFYLIVLYVWRLWTGQFRESPDDIRDEEVEEEYAKQKQLHVPRKKDD